MPRLTVRQLKDKDVYKDMVRIAEVYRIDEDGDPIEESTVCWIDGTPQSSVAVLRGCKKCAYPVIHMDERTRNRLGVQIGDVYEFVFRRAGMWGQLRWAWDASETGYRVASRLAVMGFVLGLLAFIPVLVDLVASVWRCLRQVR